MSAASKRAMEQLHAALAGEMKKILEDGVKEVTKDGEVVQVTAGAQYLNAIRQFLKDNGIEAQMGNTSPGAKPFDELKSKALPFLTREDDDGDFAEH